jgi:hypothetical protein
MMRKEVAAADEYSGRRSMQSDRRSRASRRRARIEGIIGGRRIDCKKEGTVFLIKEK